MPKCPFCRRNIRRVDVHQDAYSGWEWYTCPECGEELPITTRDLDDFLEEKYVILHPDDPEIVRKGDIILFRERVYKIDKIASSLTSPFLTLTLVEDELVADILKECLGEEWQQLLQGEEDA